MIPGKKHSKCKLCGEETQLCESHIIPELCHKRIYDDKHRAIEGRFQNGELRKRTLQKGKREYLLCSGCEGILNKYETSFSKYWYGPDGLPDKIDGDFLVLKNADCYKFKLFHLSIIWRVSVSSEFSAISLGPYYNKAIRKILLNESPIPQGHYPIIGCVLTDDGGHVHEQVSGPIKGRHDDSTSYILSYAGCEWLIIITDHPTRDQINLSEKAISTDGKIKPSHPLSIKRFTISSLCEATLGKHKIPLL